MSTQEQGSEDARAGLTGPTIELLFGANTMVAAKGGTLSVSAWWTAADASRAPRMSVVIGGHMMEDNLMEFDLQTSPLGFSSSLLFWQMACNNFRLS
jgi:hypothetical protein